MLLLIDNRQSSSFQILGSTCSYQYPTLRQNGEDYRPKDIGSIIIDPWALCPGDVIHKTITDFTLDWPFAIFSATVFQE